MQEEHPAWIQSASAWETPAHPTPSLAVLLGTRGVRNGSGGQGNGNSAGQVVTEREDCKHLETAGHSTSMEIFGSWTFPRGNSSGEHMQNLLLHLGTFSCRCPDA